MNHVWHVYCLAASLKEIGADVKKMIRDGVKVR